MIAVYEGKRDVYREGSRGAQLNPNHSHYLLFDDGSDSKFGNEISLRTELIDFISYRRDVDTADIETLTQSQFAVACTSRQISDALLVIQWCVIGPVRESCL